MDKSNLRSIIKEVLNNGVKKECNCGKSCCSKKPSIRESIQKILGEINLK